MKRIYFFNNIQLIEITREFNKVGLVTAAANDISWNLGDENVTDES